MFEGILTALVTPMKEGKVDLDALIRLLDRQIDAQVQGVVICATTGEGATLNREEKRLVAETTIGYVEKKLKVILGISEVATWAAVDTARMGASLGVDGVLVATPPYVRASQDGMAAHFEAVADQSGLPVIVYNVPSRTGSDVLPATLARLAGHENIVAVKEATGSVQRAQQVLAAVGGRMNVLSGDDPLTLSLLVAGGHGVISTGANVVPELWSRLWGAWKSGDLATAARQQSELLGLHESLFLETNPGPAKAALHLLGCLEPEIRSPLTWPAAPTIYRLAAELENLGYEPLGMGE